MYIPTHVFLCHVTVQFTFLNSIVILLIISLVQTEGLFLSLYLQTNFTVMLILSVKSLVKVIRNRTFQAFFILSFPLVYTEKNFPSVFTSGYSDGKVYR